MKQVRMYYRSGTGGGCCIRRRADTVSLTRWQHFSAWNDVKTAILKLWCQIENLTASVDLYLLGEQSSQISARSGLKRRSLRLFEEVAPKRTTI